MTTDGEHASAEGDDGFEAYADLGATTGDAMEIAETSMDRVRELVPDETLGDRIRQKAVHATGDPEFQHLVRFSGAAPEAVVRAGARAVLEERPIVTDITMVKAGITGRGHDCGVQKAIGNGSELAERTGMTRTAASVLELDRAGLYDDVIAVVGNAPTAALALADCIEDGTRPAAIVATPVGFVKAATSRERVREVADAHDIPAITTVGRRGGSGLAAGLTNELVHVASDARSGTLDADLQAETDDVSAGATDDYDLADGPDAAARAAATPEPAAGTQDPIPAVGIGPGNPAYLTTKAREILETADVVVGFETVLDHVEDLCTGETLGCGYQDEADTLGAFGSRVADGAPGAAVLMGDPNHSGYQFVGKVEDAVDRPVQVIPGISSLQLAASRARVPMEASEFVTLHKSGPIEAELRTLRSAVEDQHLLVLPRPFDWMPEDVASMLLEAGAAPQLEALVFERLTQEGERRTATTLRELAAKTAATPDGESPFSDLSVLVVRAPRAT
jgi:precorrin-8X/cobalt-precorrin-8 methylmutase